MIRGREWRTLKGQLVLTGVMCGTALAAAIVMATQVSLAEKYIREKYDLNNPSEDLGEIIAAARRGEVDRVEYLKLDVAARVQIYADWMSQAEPSLMTPPALMKVDAAFYVRRFERSIVCGDGDQRRQAFQFLRAAPTVEALPALEKLIRWARRRNLIDLKKSLVDARDDLKKRLESNMKEQRP